MILKETEIKYIFNPYVLLPGDILLMNTYEEIFREKMKCQYEHAAIYVGNAYFMEANGAHVVMNHIYSYAFREQNHACVLRLKKYSGKNYNYFVVIKLERSILALPTSSSLMLNLRLPVRLE